MNVNRQQIVIDSAFQRMSQERKGYCIPSLQLQYANLKLGKTGLRVVVSHNVPSRESLL